jgi:hypothetical protein
MIGRYSPLQHCQYLAIVLFFNIANIWTIFYSATLPIFGRYFHLEPANNVWNIFSSATLSIQYLVDILIFKLPFGKILLCNFANIWQIFSHETCHYLEIISLCNFANILKIFSSATLPIFDRYSPLQHAQLLADIFIWKFPIYEKYTTLQLCQYSKKYYILQLCRD